MTTENIKGIDALNEATAAVAKSVSDRKKANDDARQAIINEAKINADKAAINLKNHKIAERVLEQQAHDQQVKATAAQAEYDEEDSQLDYILNGTRSASSPPATLVEVVPEPVATPVVPVPPPADAPTAVLVTTEEPEATEELGFGKTKEITVTKRTSNPLGWNWRGRWWLILLGLIVGLAAAALLWDVFDLHTWFFESGGRALGTLLSVLYWLAWPLAGFFIAGYFSSSSEEANEKPAVVETTVRN